MRPQLCHYGGSGRKSHPSRPAPLESGTGDSGGGAQVARHQGGDSHHGRADVHYRHWNIHSHHRLVRNDGRGFFPYLRISFRSDFWSHRLPGRLRKGETPPESGPHSLAEISASTSGGHSVFDAHALRRTPDPQRVHSLGPCTWYSRPL